MSTGYLPTSLAAQNRVQSASAVSAPGGAEVPVYRQVITWLLFWPLLTLIAEQAVLFSGPAHSATYYEGGAAMNGARVAHSDYSIYVEFAIQLCFAIAGRRQIVDVLRKNKLIPASLTLAALSALWSSSPIVTIQMTISVTLCTLFACYLSERLSTERLMQTLMFMGVVSCVLSIVFALALPSYGIFAGYGGGAWQGICNHKNTLGRSMGFLLMPVFFVSGYGRTRKVLYAALLLFLVAMSQSRGAWLYTAGTLLFIGWFHLVRRLRQSESVLLVVLAIVAVMCAGGLAAVQLKSILLSLGKDPTMSGRTVIYGEVLASILKHPLVGYGYGAFWHIDPESFRIGVSIGWPNIGYSENGVLELALQLGVVGVACVFALILKAVRQGIRLLRSPWYSPQVGWFMSILFYVTLTNIDAGWLLTPHLLDWVLIIVACVGLNDAVSRAQLKGANRSVSLIPAHLPEQGLYAIHTFRG